MRSLQKNWAFVLMCVSVITLKTERLALTLNDCLSSGLKLNLVGKVRSPGLKTPALRLGEPVQSPCGGALARPVTSAGGLARSPTLTRGAPRSPARPAPARRSCRESGCPSAPRLGRWRERKGPRGRGKTGAGAVVSASPTRAQVPRRRSLGRSPWGRLGREGAVAGAPLG